MLLLVGSVALVGLGELPTSKLFQWASTRGAHIANELALSPAVADRPRGLVVTADVPAGAILLTLPAALQLGVESCSEHLGLDVMLAATPPVLWSARLGLALLTEKRQGPASPFAEFIDELPPHLTCCLAPTRGGDASVALAAWPPTAARAHGMRAALRSLHSKLAPIAQAPTFEQVSRDVQ